MTARHFLMLLLCLISIGAMSRAEQTSLPGGTRIEDQQIGDGLEAQPGHKVVVNYTGWLYVDDAARNHRGAQFDSSAGKGPISFVLGEGKVIKGWDDGIAGMKESGKRTLIIPPDAAYGRQGNRGIPPNSWLIFDVELVEVD